MSLARCKAGDWRILARLDDTAPRCINFAMIDCSHMPFLSIQLMNPMKDVLLPCKERFFCRQNNPNLILQSMTSGHTSSHLLWMLSLWSQKKWRSSLPLPSMMNAPSSTRPLKSTFPSRPANGVPRHRRDQQTLLSRPPKLLSQTSSRCHKVRRYPDARNQSFTCCINNSAASLAQYHCKYKIQSAK